MLIGVSDVEAAAARLAGVTNPTPLLEFRRLNERAGGRVLLKPENLQRTGSFKIRGAYNAMSTTPADALANGVVAWSSGNHAQGVAEAARLFGVEATIVLPDDAPAGKVAATEALGARLVRYDRYREDREVIGRRIATERNARLIPSYDDPAVIAGQGTVGLEIASDPLLGGAAPDTVLVCCGGGGLVAGSAVALHDRFPGCRVFAVEPEAADDTARSFASGERLANPPDTRSVCDALLTPSPGELTFPINQAHLEDVLLVSDREALDAVAFAFRELRLVLEPGGAVALAALLAGRVALRDRTTVVVLSGGNIGREMMARALAGG